MSAISSNLASILLPSYSSSAHGSSCSCSSCSSKGSLNSSSSTSAQGSGSTGSTDNSSAGSSAAAPKDAQGKPLTKDQQSELSDLKKTDAAVRRHEQAHLSAAGSYARSGIVLNYKTGPDGKQYAVGGHVDIDTSPVSGNPSATITKMETVQRAALAPSDPSGQDRNVASEAARAEGKARAQLIQKQSGSSDLPSVGVTAKATAAKYSQNSQRVSPAAASTSTASSDTSTSAGSGQLLDVVG